VALARLGKALDTAYRQTAANLPANRDVRIERVDGKDRLVLTPLEKLDDPPSLQALREQVASRLPRIDLPDALLEIQARTGFAQEFTHLSEGNARVADLPTSLCAILLAQACNVGLETVVQPGVPALTQDRLLWVQQNYLRAETLLRANARLVEAQSRLPLAQRWGGRRSRLRRRAALPGADPHHQRRAEPEVLPGARRHLFQFHQRPVQRLARHRHPRHTQRRSPTCSPACSSSKRVCTQPRS